MAHVAGLIAAGLYPNPVPSRMLLPVLHTNPCAAARCLILCKSNPEIEKKSFQYFRHTGGPSMHIIAAKAVAFKEAMEPEFRVYQQQVIKNAQAWPKFLSSVALM